MILIYVSDHFYFLNVNKKLVFILAIDCNLFKILTLNRNKKLMIIAISVFNVLNSNATTYVRQ